MAVIEGNTAEKYLEFAEEFCKSFVQINHGPSPDQTGIASIHFNITNLPKPRLDDIKKRLQLEDSHIKRNLGPNNLPHNLDPDLPIDLGFLCQAAARRLDWTDSATDTVRAATSRILADPHKKKIFSIMGIQVGGIKHPKQIMIIYLSGFSQLFRRGYYAYYNLHRFLPKITEYITQVKSIESSIRNNFNVIPI